LRSRDLIYWLQGYFELTGTKSTINKEQLDLIKKHLAMVFKYEMPNKDIMEGYNFCLWLKGGFDMLENKTFSINQIESIKTKLNLVFKHEIDPSFGELEGELNKIHNPPIINIPKSRPGVKPWDAPRRLMC